MMIELVLGFALGAMVFTDQGREIGNKVAATAAAQIKKMQEEIAKNDNKA